MALRGWIGCAHRTEPRRDVGLLVNDLPALAGAPVAVPLVKVASIDAGLISHLEVLAAVDIWL